MSSPRTLSAEVRDCICTKGMPIERVLPLVTTTAARVLKLSSKGIEPGAGADLLLVDQTKITRLRAPRPARR